MKIPSLLLVGVLCAGILSSGACPAAMADAGSAPESRSVAAESIVPASPMAGTMAEARAYELREEISPEVQDFKGGDGVFIGGGFILLVLIVVLIIVLMGD